MKTNFQGGEGKPPEALRRRTGGSSKKQHPLNTPTLRNFQPVNDERGGTTIGRTFRPVDASELRLSLVTNGEGAMLRLSEFVDRELQGHFDLRRSDIPAVINSLHEGLTALGGRL